MESNLITDKQHIIPIVDQGTSSVGTDQSTVSMSLVLHLLTMVLLHIVIFQMLLLTTSICFRPISYVTAPEKSKCFHYSLYHIFF